MELRFDQKVAVVTGAASGIGFACARELARSGARVVLLGRSGKKLEQAAELLALPGQVFPMTADLSDSASLSGLVADIRRQVGEINLLIQSARFTPTGEEPDQLALWDASLNTNAKSVWALMKEAVEQSMLPRGGGSVVNIASMAGIRGMLPPLTDFAYSAGKGAVNAITRQGAVCWGRRGVRVNAIAPGGVASGGVGVSDQPRRPADDPDLPYLDLIPTGRHSYPEEVAALACFLCADCSANLTGQVLVLDGGASIIGM